MAIETEVLARELHWAAGDSPKWDALPDNQRECLRRQANNLMLRLLISPRSERAPLTAGEAMLDGYYGTHSGNARPPSPRSE
jgi:hypothetical protein